MSKLSKVYRTLTPREHILLRPDTYLGAMEATPLDSWAPGEQATRTRRRRTAASGDTAPFSLTRRSLTISPALMHSLTELIANAADAVEQRGEAGGPGGSVPPRPRSVSVTMNGDAITVHNSPSSLPVVQQDGEWIPTTCFGALFSGSNFDIDPDAPVAAGRNGFGAKLSNITSHTFSVDTCDGISHFRQTWHERMARADEPTVVPCSHGGVGTCTHGTAVSVVPDLSLFPGTDALASPDLTDALRVRLWETAVSLGANVDVRYNGGDPFPPAFVDYCRAYDTIDPATLVLHEGPQHLLGVARSRGTPTRVSFVNNIATPRGGSHVRLFADAVLDAALGGSETATRRSLAPHLGLFLSVRLSAPSFDTQTKTKLVTSPSSLPAAWTLPKSEARRLATESTLTEAAAAVGATRARATLRQSVQAKVSIPKLQDAHDAGTRRAADCTLILTEGDSAKALAVAGIASLGPEGAQRFGVFPLRGKVLNVRDAATSRIAGSEELSSVAKALGLQYGKDVARLRYGRLLIMTDQDADGAHIKGLILNYFHVFWPSLLERNDFISFFRTPLLRARSGDTTLDFFSTEEYDAWRSSVGEAAASRYAVKYYKGLGTSTSREARAYFAAMDRHVVRLSWSPDTDPASMAMAFAKEEAAARRAWISATPPPPCAETTQTFSHFVHFDLATFARSHLARSIPSVVDGLKPSQRKALWGLATRPGGGRKEVKVAQLAAHVSEVSHYHHGEGSLATTIIGMAQDFVGSGNNLPLLQPLGQFGTRLCGGRDAASPRYLYTALSPVARLLFPPQDDEVLPSAMEEGVSVEPVTYSPVIPLVLVNGAEGLGTGWSTSIPPHDPLDVVDATLAYLDGQEVPPLTPAFRGFQGTVTPVHDGAAGDSDVHATSWLTTGVYHYDEASSTLVISELPPKRWTTSYKEFLDTLVAAGRIRSFVESHSESTVSFTLSLTAAQASSLLRRAPASLRLTTPLRTSNMHLFSPSGKLVRYNSTTEIIADFARHRLDTYHARRDHLLSAMDDRVDSLERRQHFVRTVLGDPTLLRDEQRLASVAKEAGDPGLVDLPLRLVSEREADRVAKALANARQEREAARARTALDLWRTDLAALRVWLTERAEREADDD